MDWLVFEDSIMEYRNPKRFNDTLIDCEINHPIYGWIPFTCDPNDTGAMFDVAELHARLDADPSTIPYKFPTQEELNDIVADDVRTKRNKLLLTVVDRTVSNPLRWAEMTPEQQQAWAEYRTALLEIPQQSGFPYSVIWPKQP